MHIAVFEHIRFCSSYHTFDSYIKCFKSVMFMVVFGIVWHLYRMVIATHHLCSRFIFHKFYPFTNGHSDFVSEKREKEKESVVRIVGMQIYGVSVCVIVAIISQIHKYTEYLFDYDEFVRIFWSGWIKYWMVSFSC